MKRFTDMLANLARRYPELWRNIDRMRASRGEGAIADWPEWCFIPDHLTADFISANKKSGNRNVQANDVVLLPTLAAWRPSQAVFRFSEPLFARLAGRDAGEASCLTLFHLPVWCCYVETPGAGWTGAAMDGFFVYMTSTEDGPELRFVPCAFPQRTFVSLPLPVGEMSVSEALEASLIVTAARKKQDLDIEKVRSSAQWRQYETMMGKMLSLALFLCSGAVFADAEGKAGFTGNPVPKRTKQGLRMFPAQKPRLWLVSEGGA